MDTQRAGADMDTTLQVIAPHFTAGIVVDEHGIVREAAPIVQYMVGMHIQEVREYCDYKGWFIDGKPE